MAVRLPKTRLPHTTAYFARVQSQQRYWKLEFAHGRIPMMPAHYYPMLPVPRHPHLPPLQAPRIKPPSRRWA